MSTSTSTTQKPPAFKRPSPEELAQLRELFPRGAPRIDYRESLLVLPTRGRAPAPDPDGDGDAGGAEGMVDDTDAAATDPLAPIPLAISSEAPVLRYDWWDDEMYYEVLDHAAGSIVLDYARDGLPFVASHRSYDADQQHGIVEDVAPGKDRTLRGTMRPSRAQRSQEIAQDMRDGIRKKVSVGYIVGDEYEQTTTKGSEIPTRRYTAWMPIEVSTVPVPADYSVGVGRARAAEGQLALARFLSLHPPRASRAAEPLTSPSAAPKAKERTMEGDNQASGGATNDGTSSGNTNEHRNGPVNVTGITERANEAAALRIANITAMATAHAAPPEKLTEWIRSGASELVVSQQINEMLAERMKKPIQTVSGPDISAKDARRFSFARALMLNTELMGECQKQPGGSKIDFGFERELLQEVQRMTAATRGGNVLPYNLFGRAGVDSGTTTTGGPFKFTQPGEFIPILRNKTSVMRAGSTVLNGLTGPVTFPKQNGAASTQYVAENPGSDLTVTNLTTTTVTLSFKSMGAATAFSRQMLFSAASGNYDIEAIIQSDIAAVIGLAVDLGSLNGSGATSNPKGLLKNTSIGSVTLGTNGGTMAWGSWVDLETAIGDANADTGRMSYITNTKQRGVAKKSAVLASTASSIPIWSGPYPTTPGGPAAGGADAPMDGIVNGYRAIASNQVPRNLTKGTSTTACSAVIFGAFEHNLIGIFGNGYETIVDPYSKKFQGMVEVAAWVFFDCAQRYDEAFAAVQDAL